MSYADAPSDSKSRWGFPDAVKKSELEAITESDGCGEYHSANKVVQSIISSGTHSRRLLARDVNECCSQSAETREVVLKRDARSNFGLKISTVDDPGDHHPFITNAAEGARAAGLRDGDTVLEVDGVATLGRPLRSIFAQLMQRSGDICLVLRSRAVNTPRSPETPAREIRGANTRTALFVSQTVTRRAGSLSAS